MTALPLSAAEQERLDAIDAAPAAPESWFPEIASEGPFGPQQVSHRARPVKGSPGRSVTACGKEFGGPDDHPDWETWGVSGGLVGDEWPPVTCPRCPQPVRPHADAVAALQRVLALAEKWDTDRDARYSHNRIARSTAARAVREAVTGAPETPR